MDMHFMCEMSMWHGLEKTSGADYCESYFTVTVGVALARTEQ